MIFNNCHNFIKVVKKVTIYSIALFIVVFALADVSILQAYHGSEVVGIPPAHHSEQKTDCEFDTEQTVIDQTFTDQTDSNKSYITSHNHNSDDDCPGEGECLASCSHIVVSYFVFNSSLFSNYRQNRNPSSYEDTIPKSEPTNIFHPPQTA